MAASSAAPEDAAEVGEAASAAPEQAEEAEVEESATKRTRLHAEFGPDPELPNLQWMHLRGDWDWHMEAVVNIEAGALIFSS